MCHAVSELHADCQHTKRTSNLYPCEAGFQTGTGCNAQRFTSQLVTVISPSVCVDCYRLIEARICHEADVEREELLESIERAMDTMETANELHAAKLAVCKDEAEKMAEIERHTEKVVEIDDIIVEWQETLEDLAEEKKDTLAKFREEQGVWGDG